MLTETSSAFKHPDNNTKARLLRACFHILMVGSVWSGFLVLPVLSQADSERMKLSQIPTNPARIEGDARKWTNRLITYQESYYQKFGVFATDLSQLDKVSDAQYGLVSNLKNHQFYEFFIKESSGAVYSYSIPKTPNFMGFASAMFFDRVAEPKSPLQNIQLFTCHGSKKGDYPSEPILKNGRVSCSMAKATLDSTDDKESSPSKQEKLLQSGGRSNSTRRNRDRVQDAVIKEVQKTVPKVINKILK
jgi:hypothetical protein